MLTPDRKTVTSKWPYTVGGKHYTVQISWSDTAKSKEDTLGVGGAVKGLHALAFPRWGDTSRMNLANTLIALNPSHFGLSIVPCWKPGDTTQITNLLKNLYAQSSQLTLYLTMFASYHGPSTDSRYHQPGQTIQSNSQEIGTFLSETLPSYSQVVPIVSPGLEDTFGTDDALRKGIADMVFGIYQGCNYAPTFASLHVRRSQTGDGLKNVLTATVTPAKPSAQEITWTVTLNLHREYHLNYDGRAITSYSNDGEYVFDANADSPVVGSGADGTVSNAKHPSAESVVQWMKHIKYSPPKDVTAFYNIWRPKYNLWHREQIARGKQAGKYHYIDSPAHVWDKDDTPNTTTYKGDDIAFNTMEMNVLNTLMS